MWLACFTQEEIAAKVEVARTTIDNWINDFAKSSGPEVLAKFSESAFKVPIYNIWKVQNKSNPVSHFGKECLLVTNQKTISGSSCILFYLLDFCRAYLFYIYVIFRTHCLCA